MATTKIKICRVVNSEFFLRHHLEYQIRAQILAGFEVHLVYPKESMDGLKEFYKGAIHHELRISRRPNPFQDLIFCLKLFLLLRHKNIHLIHSATPKAALIACLAGFIARTPIRLHTFTGQVWQDFKGFKRIVFKFLDWLVINLNTHCYADSHSQASFLMTQKISKKDQISVIGAGSLSGFDISKFDKKNFEGAMDRIREGFRFNPNDFVLNFTGRVTVDKGIRELIEAVYAPEVFKRVKLLIVGPLEGEQTFKDYFLRKVSESQGRIVYAGYQSEPGELLAVSNLFVLPSYREGFGGVLVEAALLELPCISTRIPGPIDAVEHGETGWLIDPKSSKVLRDAILMFLNDEGMIRKMSLAARKRAVRLFDQKEINRLLVLDYLQFAQIKNIQV